MPNPNQNPTQTTGQSDPKKGQQGQAGESNAKKGSQANDDANQSDQKVRDKKSGSY